MPDLLVYGLAGWSWGGFEMDQTLPYTLSGFTYEGGIERDFGWLRGFIQVKTINYREKNIITGNGSTSTSTSTQTTAFGDETIVSTSVHGGQTDSRLSAHVTSITAGVTLPLNFLR
jgi:hypothetical protein